MEEKTEIQYKINQLLSEYNEFKSEYDSYK